MDGHTFVSWNLPNMVTVWLMAAVLGAIVYGVKRAHDKTQQG